MVSRHEELSDSVLVTNVARGDHGALAEIYRRHGGSSFRLACRILNDQRLAEDVCQDVFLTLWNNPELYDAERGSLRAWISMKTHGRSVDAVRASAARFARENREINDPSARDYDLEREVWELTVAERIQQALVELPSGENEAVRLAYFGGLTYREVAAHLGEPEGTVKSRIRSGLQTLGRLLHDLQGDTTPDPGVRPPRAASQGRSGQPSDSTIVTAQKNRWGR